MPREVEIKFVVRDAKALTRRLRALGFREITPRTHEMNVLYDLPGHPLRQRGELLRLRKYGDRWVLTHKSKGTAKRHKERAETETAVADGKQMHRILLALGFAISFRYEKFRSEWSDGKGHVVLDDTPIGSVAEIEGQPRWIDASAKALEVPRGSYIMQSYAELFQQWKERTGSNAGEMTFKALRQRASKPAGIRRP